MRNRYIALLTISTLAFAPAFSVSSDDFEVTVKMGSQNEKFDRAVDAAAISSQKKAISKLSILLKRYKGTRKEPLLLKKLAKAYLDSASIAFRLAHGKSSKHANLKSYQSDMKKCISTIDVLLRKYPNRSDNGLAYFMRAKAYEEIKKVREATRDYIHVVRNFPELPEVVQAYMSLAQFSIDANNHQLALKYLKPIEQMPGSPHYPFAIYKAAWSHFNLGHIDTSLKYLEKHIRYYSKDLKPNDPMVNSDQAILENSLNNATMFFAEGYEKEGKRYHPSRALSFFKDLHNGPYLGQMNIRYAKILRSHKHDKELIEWKNELVDEEIDRIETIEVARITFEHLVNEREYDEVIKTSKDFITLYQHHIKKGKPSKELIHTLEDARLLVLKTADQLRQVAVKNSTSKDIKKLNDAFVGVYLSFIQIVDKTDPRVPGVHFNLAEALFKTKDFERSTQHYQWLVNNWNRKFKLPESKITKQDVELRMISSRYRQLLAMKIIPKKIAPLALDENSSKDLPELAVQWMSWLENHIEQHGLSTQTLQNFYFESNRMLYSNKNINLSLERMSQFIKKNPDSRFAIPSATLIIDTYVKSQDWKTTHSLARSYLSNSHWKDKEFKAKLTELSANAAFKVIEYAHKKERHEEVVEYTNKFIKQFPNSARLEDIYLVAGKSAAELGQNERSEEYFTQLINRFPKSENTAAAFLARATQEENRFEFKEAAQDYTRYLAVYLKLKNKKDDKILELKSTILHLLWLSGSYEELASKVKTNAYCSESLEKDCDRYKALIIIHHSNPFNMSVPEMVRHAINTAPRDNRSLWALAALENQSKMPFPDRMVLVRLASSGWSDLDKLVQFSVLPNASVSIPRAFTLNRMAMNRFAQIRADEKSIKRRVNLIKEMEDSSTRVMKLPWARIRASVMHEVAMLYIDLSQGLSKLRLPSGLSNEEKKAYQEMVQKLVLPFEEKGFEIQRKAFEIASKYSIEENELFKISSFFFENNPSQAQKLGTSFEIKNYPKIDHNMLVDLNGKETWEAIYSKKENFYKNPERYTRLQWANALKGKQWHQAAFIVREVKNKKWWKENQIKAAQAISLALVGAKAESLALLDDLRGDLDEKVQNVRLRAFLAMNYVHSFSKDKAKDYIEELDDESSQILDSLKNENEAFIIALGAHWTQADIGRTSFETLLKEATDASEKSQVEWAKRSLVEIGANRSIASDKSKPKKKAGI